MYPDRPIFDRLPAKGYQDNPNVGVILEYIDEKIVSTGVLASQLYRQLDPAVADSKYLDWLAYLVGAVGDYWRVSWADSVKRAILSEWKTLTTYRGTRRALEIALNAHGVPYRIWESTDVAVPLTVPVTVGSTTYSVFVTLPLSLGRNSYHFVEAKRAVKSYTAAANPVITCYDRFYAGISAVGEPLF